MAEPIRYDFGFAAAPGGGWPPIMGSTTEEVGVAANLRQAFTVTTPAPPEALTPWSPQSLGAELAAGAATLLEAAAENWPAVDTAYYVPVRMDFTMNVTQMFWYADTLAAGDDCEAGIYSAAGNLLVTTGNIDISGDAADTMRAVTVSKTTLLPGNLYYMALWGDQVTPWCHMTGIYAAQLRAWGVSVEGSLASGLPATFTRAAPSQHRLPFFGMATENWV